MDALLALLSLILGDDHRLVAALTDAEPASDAVEYDGTPEQVEALTALFNVSDDTIAEVVTALRDAAQSDDIDTAQVIEAADIVQGLKFVQDVRSEASAAEAEARAEALAKMGDPEPAEEETAEEVAEPAAETAEVETTEEAETVTEPQPVAASRPRIGNVARRQPKAAKPVATDAAQFEAAAAASKFRIVDSIGGEYERGTEVDIDTVALALADKYAQFGSTPANGYEQHRVATFRTDYPDEQQLGPDFQENQRRIRRAVEAMVSRDAALTASVCAPPQPIYEIVTVGTEARPVKDFLPAFQATRGGIIFRPGLPLSSAGTLNADSSGVTTNWVDGDANKFLLSVACPTTETASVEAFVARAEVSNMQGQFDPESVAAALRLQMVLWARGAETSLLNSIQTNSTLLQAETTAIVGFSRNLLVKINQLAVGTRSRERMDKDAPLDCMLPSWVIAGFQDDLALEQPGAQEERLATTQAQIEDWFAVRNIRVGWFLDQQLFGTQAAGNQITDYPQQVTGYLFEPGHHLFLDGGDLNLGIIRDSTLNNTNEYQTFTETFEALASRGVVSYAFVLNVCRTGTTGAAAEIACDEIS